MEMRKERRSHGDEEVNAKLLTKQLPVSRGVEASGSFDSTNFLERLVTGLPQGNSSLQPIMPFHSTEGT